VKQDLRHIDAGIYLEPGFATGAIYAMHPQGNNLPPKVVSEFIRAYTREGDIVLDPFGGSGTTAVEALRLGRRAITTDPNPLASFYSEVAFTPVSLPQLQWAFQDIQGTCGDGISELFATACPKCGQKGVAVYLHRENGKLVRIEYTCPCSPKRLSKRPDAGDRRAEEENARLDIPFWHPTNLPLPPSPATSLRYPSDFLHRRTAAALSMILNATDNLDQHAVRDAMKLAFASALAACHRFGPLSAAGTAGTRERPEKRLTALRRRPPLTWVEVNPWHAFADGFRRMYDGKKEGNSVLRNATAGYGYGELESGQANVIILGKSAEDALICELPDSSVDYVLTEPPIGRSEADLFLSAVQAAWLRMEFDYHREIDIAPERGRSVEQYRGRMLVVFNALRRVVRDGSYAHLFYGDSAEAHFPAFLSLLQTSGLGAEHIHYQPLPEQSGSLKGARSRVGGGYIVRIPVSKNKPAAVERPVEGSLRSTIAEAARDMIAIHGGKTTPNKILHSLYQRLDKDDIAAWLESSIDDLLSQAVESFALYRDGKFTLRGRKAAGNGRRNIPEKWRRVVLDAESLVTGDRDETDAARQLALQRLAPEGLTSEDVSAIRESLRAAEVGLHRRKRATLLLRAWGKALGYPSSTLKNTSHTILWKTSAGRKIIFTLGKKGIGAASHFRDGTVSQWGSLSYFDLERGLREWCRTHPAPGADLLQRLTPVDDFSWPEKAGPRAKTSPVKDLKLKTVSNRGICDRHFLIGLELPRDVRLDFLPGQFFHILCDPEGGKTHPYPLTLRRPLSVHHAEYPGFHRAALARVDDLPEEIREAVVRYPSRIDFLYRVVGKGTEALSRVRKGAELYGIGPCGNGFGIGRERTAVIVSGGIGVAPLAALAERLRYSGKEVLVYLGAVKKEMLNLAVSRLGAGPGREAADRDRELLDAIESEFQEIGARVLTVCTDDGSLGEKGLVTEMLEQGIRNGCVPRRDVRVYACGPEGMLRTVAEIAARYSLDCEVSLEERMACGIGACYSCTIRVIGPGGAPLRKRVCKEGPVFRTRDIQWKD